MKTERTRSRSGQLVKRGWLGLAVLLLTWASAQDAADLFPGMEPFPYIAYEKFVHPEIVDNYDEIEVSVEQIEPDGVGYRYFIAEESTPSILYEDVCPAGYETVWYTFASAARIPISIMILDEVQFGKDVGLDDRTRWFSTNFADQYRERAGNPTHYGPVYVAFCAYSDARGDYERFYNTAVTNESFDIDVTVTCQILVNNSGNREVLAEDSGLGVWHCFGED